MPRHTETDAVTTLITTRSLVPHPALIPVFPYLRPMVALARRTPARRLLGLALKLRAARTRALATPDALPRPSQPPHFAIVLEVTERTGARRRGVVKDGDFHRVTVATLAFGAQALASEAFGGHGALAPATAVEAQAVFDALAPLNVTVRVDRSS